MVTVLLAAAQPAAPGAGTLLVAAAVAALAYLLSCAWRPYARRCPWPWCTRGREMDRSKFGNYRRRRACRMCGGKDWRRVGARLIGRG